MGVGISNMFSGLVNGHDGEGVLCKYFVCCYTHTQLERQDPQERIILYYAAPSTGAVHQYYLKGNNLYLNLYNSILRYFFFMIGNELRDLIF